MPSPLDEHSAPHQPWDLFRDWYEAARPLHPPEPDAMTLATVGADGRPSARIVLLKQFDDTGLVFHSHYDSRKGEDLAHHPVAALLFYWPAQLRQVRIEGSVSRLEPEMSDAYFKTRPRDSQIGAWASLQSQTIPSRETFEQRFEAVEKKFEGLDVPRPPHWSGFRVVPERIEFWYGAKYRLHERHHYERVDGAWTKRLLYP
jgi:pyridoxamine 5'-phosphate oxidase